MRSLELSAKNPQPDHVRSEVLPSSLVRPECFYDLPETRCVGSVILNGKNSTMIVEAFKKLCELFKSKAEQLCSYKRFQKMIL